VLEPCDEAGAGVCVVDEDEALRDVAGREAAVDREVAEDVDRDVEVLERDVGEDVGRAVVELVDREDVDDPDRDVGDEATPEVVAVVDREVFRGAGSGVAPPPLSRAARVAASLARKRRDSVDG
jgi:hypothetical protein